MQFFSKITVPHVQSVRWDFGDGTGSSDVEPLHTFNGKGPFDVRLSVIGDKETVVDDFTRVQFPDVIGSGLIANYTDDAGHVLSRIDPNIDFEWPIDAGPMPSDVFDIKWTGEIAPSVSDVYTFEVRTEGEAVLRIGGNEIINTAAGVANPIRLEAGRHYTFTLVVTGEHQGSTTQLLWSSGPAPRLVVPTTAFYPASGKRRSVGH